jgi:serine O-acetyltransferase
MRAHREGQPPLGRALRTDARIYAAMRGESFSFKSNRRAWLDVLRLLLVSNDYLGFALYRLRIAMRGAGIPILPRLVNKLCVALFSIRIGDHVLIEEGVYVNHGYVVIDGVTRISSGSIVTAWAMVGPEPGGLLGPTVGPAVFIGTQASIVGDISVGRAARIGSGAVVLSDVPANAVVAGVPAVILAENVPGPFQASLLQQQP